MLEAQEVLFIQLLRRIFKIHPSIAIEEIKKFQGSPENTENKDLQFKCFDLLATLYEDNGEFDKALDTNEFIINSYGMSPISVLKTSKLLFKLRKEAEAIKLIKDMLSFGVKDFVLELSLMNLYFLEVNKHDDSILTLFARLFKNINVVLGINFKVPLGNIAEDVNNLFEEIKRINICLQNILSSKEKDLNEKEQGLKLLRETINIKYYKSLIDIRIKELSN